MYELYTANTKTEKRLNEYISNRDDIKNKLENLKINPRKSNGVHPLHGRFEGKWACWLGSNIRLIYSINDSKQIIIIEAVGTHKLYG